MARPWDSMRPNFPRSIYIKVNIKPAIRPATGPAKASKLISRRGSLKMD